MNTTVFYFTGTGNSYQISKWIEEKNPSITQIIPIEKAKKEDIPIEKNQQMIIVGPTHGFTLTWTVFKFLLWLPFGKGLGAQSITCRAAWKVGPYFLPGLSGSANFVVALILFLKGYNARGLLAIDMPSNWLVMHWGLHPKNIILSFDKAKIKLTAFLDRKRHPYFTLDNIYEFIFGAILLRISFMYFCFARLIFAKIFFAGKDCTGCGFCEKQCPVGAIKMYKKYPFWRYNCESCMRCVAGCPTEAINASHLWFVLLMFLGAIPVATFLGVTHMGLTLLTSLCFTLLGTWILYYLLYLLSRIPLLDKFFTYTSLSHYFRRYRVKAYFEELKKS